MSDLAESLDVLRTPLFTIAPGDERMSLAGLVARLLRGPEVIDFPQVAPEQRSYWWRFLVRCAAKALHELDWTVADADACDPAELATEIERVLGQLVPDGGWLLYQPDPAKPGFLQTPTPNGQPPEAKTSGYDLRAISLLTGALGSKNHERKADAVRALTPEQAVYALVEYQTAAIYGGAGNYGSQLMGSASGAGSGTPFMGARIAGANHHTFQHDTQVLLDRWPEIVASGLAGSVWALWADRWSGEKDGALLSTSLDPAFIPLARMVRLVAPNDGSFQQVFFHGTKGSRVEDHTRTRVGGKWKGGGLLGDPLTPSVQVPQPKVRGTIGKGYDYSEVVALLFRTEKGAEPSTSVQALIKREELERTDLAVLFEGVAYVQGKTVGFHRREVPLPAQGGIAWLDDPAPVRAVHTTLLKLVKEVKSAVRGAAHGVISGFDERGNPKRRENANKKAERPAELLEQRVDAVYLNFLFGAAAQYEAEGGDARYDLPLIDWLDKHAREALREGFAALPCNTNERLQREVRAAAYLGARLRRLRGENGDKTQAKEVTS